MEEKEVIDEIVEMIKDAIFNDERFLNLAQPKVEEEVVEEVVEETPTEETTEEVVEEVKDTRSTIEKIRDRLKGIR